MKERFDQCEFDNILTPPGALRPSFFCLETYAWGMLKCPAVNFQPKPHRVDPAFAACERQARVEFEQCHEPHR